MTQPASTVPACEHCPCASPTSSLLPPVTSRTQVHPGAALSSLFGRGGSYCFGSHPRILQHAPPGAGPGVTAALVPVWVPGTLPSQHSLLTVCFSMSSTILASNLPICWESVGCSLCSSKDRLSVPPVHRGKWALLPPTSPPYS